MMSESPAHTLARLRALRTHTATLHSATCSYCYSKRLLWLQLTPQPARWQTESLGRPY